MNEFIVVCFFQIIAYVLAVVLHSYRKKYFLFLFFIFYQSEVVLLWIEIKSIILIKNTEGVGIFVCFAF